MAPPSIEIKQNIPLVHQQKPPLRTYNYFARLSPGWLRSRLHQSQQFFQPGVGGRRIARRDVPGLDRDPGPHLLNRLQHPFAVERLQQVIHRIHLEGAHRILVESGGKNHLRQTHPLVQQLLEHGEPVLTWHLHIQKDNVRLVRAHQFHGFDAIRPLCHHLHAFHRLQQIQQLLPGKRFVVDDERGYGHSCQLLVAACQMAVS